MERQIRKGTTFPLPIRLFLALAIAAAAMVSRLKILPVSDGIPFATFYPSMFVTYLTLGIAPGIVGSLLAVAGAYYWFIPPFGELAWKPSGLLVMGIFIACSAAICVSVQNMIARRRQLEDLAQSQRGILNSNLVGILKFRSEKIVWANVGIEQMLGWNLGELTGQPIRVLHPDDGTYAAARKTGAAGKALGIALRRELQLVKRDGQVIWVDSHGTWINRDTDESLWVCADITARKLGEEALRRSQAFLTRTGTAAGVGGWEYDLGTQSVTHSDETCRMLELPLNNKPAFDDITRFYAPQARPLIEQAIRQAIAQGTPWDLELPMVSATGRSFWGRSVGEAEFEDGVAVRLTGALQDVTVRRWRDLAQARELTRVTLESIEDAIITTDMQGAVLWLNASACRLTGWTADQALGRPLHNVFGLIDATSRQRADAAEPSGPLVLVSRSGTEYGIEQTVSPIRDSAGNVLGTVVTFRDVTEQRWLNEAIRQRERQYRDALARLDLLFTNSPDAMLTARRTTDGRFVYETVNPIWLRAAGKAVVDVIDHSPAECLSPGAAAIVGGAWDDCVRQRRSVSYYVRSHAPDGGRDWDETIVPVPDADGSINRLIGVARDVTQRNQLEASMRQMQRMEAVGQLTAGVAHDFNNLLQAIIGALEVLHQSADLPAEALECAAVADAAAQRGATLVHRLLAFSRKQSLDPTILDAGAVFDDLAVLLTGTLGGRIRVEKSTEQGVWPVRADASQLENCLFNLALNARDAMPDGGVLSLRASNVLADAALAEGLPSGDYVRFTVEDSGTGMAPETLSRALEPFFTTKAIGKGTGLGLAMVQGFAKQSGGDVRITSVLGRGTSVSLLLPRAVRASAPATQGQNAAVTADPGRRRVLVVDDEPSICKMLTMSLNKAGFESVVHESGNLALAYLRDGGPCDLLITDQSMPSLTGNELIEHAIRLRPGLPTLLMTGHDLASGLDRLGGHVTVLRKPFRQANLIAQVKALLTQPDKAPAPAAAPGSSLANSNVVPLRRAIETVQGGGV